MKTKIPILFFLIIVPFLIFAQGGEFDKNEDLREKIRQLENKVAIQNDKISALEKNIDEKEKELDKKRVSNKAKAKVYNELSELYEQLKAENNGLRELNKSLEDLSAILRKQNKGFREENKVLKEENKSLINENYALRIENENLRKENDTLNFQKNLRVVAMECIDFGQDYVEFSFVLISDGTAEKKDVPLIIFIQKKEKQNKKDYYLKYNGKEFLETIVTTQEISRVRFESKGEFSEKNDFFKLRNNNFRIAFFHRNDETRKIIGEIKIVNLKDECYEREQNPIKP